ncbi:MAG: hypothetical protein A2X56_15525 [Nitrospirae bacterium GWC2_57_13]|jgi:hypothetical protein|nr:MAG: hypothetical protein A2072_06030 [Nitrospirae bacterium GWC1_57_7]OGW29196.1 MAG: hypothetical protein A2X56_15525 [Nitrospirae bacterium GWC2_57_13]OGW44586.1 MAG: hypothetical protein A2X57_12100 [Nitrospirae bacterium GWD2_57_8]HAR45526.1 hypothetical protein [Nitrospiraceae bacterium]HAS54087.1 hypothetical protein [Nitrospiraceae bacterium]
MKKTIVIAAMVAAVLASGVLTLSAQEPQGPRIGIPQERFDLGKVVQGEKVEHVFEIRNEGDEPLVIERIKTS